MVCFRVFLLVPTYPGCPGTKAVKRLLVVVVVIIIVIIIIIIIIVLLFCASQKLVR